MIFFKSSAIANYEKTFFDLNIESISGDKINFSDFKNNIVLVVNTASYCGFTNQYEELQILWDKYKSKGLVVLAVPSISFNLGVLVVCEIDVTYFLFFESNLTSVVLPAPEGDESIIIAPLFCKDIKN